MDKKFSIYESPLSDETKVLRRNSLLLSGLCLFIAITGELPSQFALLGVSFSANQQGLIGWFILAVAVYFFLHFISMASVEVARWIHPIYRSAVTKKTLLEDYSHAFDEEDFVNIPGQVNEQDKNDMYKNAKEYADVHVTSKLRWLYSLIYLKLTIEILVPVLIGLSSMIMILFMLVGLKET
ncbi:hypothetical protein [Aeromonas hydrophila]|uniref:hypothetical protein n=1 Tax=Aeromonas hydrophila TaxID=644 RepID=UPI003D25112F